MSSKIKRKVTVDSVADQPEDRKKPSVFERLGAARRPFGNYDESDSDHELYVQKCRNWVAEGHCPYGNKCKFRHGPFTDSVKKPHREDESPEDLRLRVKRRKEKSGEKSESDDSIERSSRSRGKKGKSIVSKSAIVMKESRSGIHESDRIGPWSEEELDYKKELELEKKRQQIQRELSRLDDEDDVGDRENFKIEKKMSRESSSDSDSAPGRTHSRGRKSGKKKKEKRSKHSRSPTKLKMQRSPSPGLDSDEHHKKHKKKSKNKKHRESFSDVEKSPEIEQKTRKLLSPLKFKKSNKAVIARTINAFHSEEEEEPSPPKKVITLPTRSRSVSSDEAPPPPKVERVKDKRSITPIKKKKIERTVSPEYVHVKEEKIKPSKKGRTRSRSSSRGRSRSYSTDRKKGKKSEKKKKIKKEEYMERMKDTSYDRSRTHLEGKERDGTPMSDFRDFSPEPDVVKKKKDKKKEKKKKERDTSVGKEDHERKHKKEKLKERERSESPQLRYSQKQEKRSLDRTSRREIDPRTRSPSAKGSREAYPDRRAKSPEPSYRGDRERDTREPREGRDARDARDIREPRDSRGDPRERDPREGREPRVDPRERDPREIRDSRDASRDQRERDTRDREPREARDPRDVRDPRERDAREIRDPRDIREPRDVREPRDIRERDPRDVREDPRELRDPRDPRERDLRDRPVPVIVPGREFDVVGRDPRELSGDRRERYPPDDRFRDERRERFEDPRFPPPPGGFEERGRYGRVEREGFVDPVDRPHYVRPDRDPRDPGDRRDPTDRRELIDRPPYDRFGGPGRGDSRFNDGPMRGGQRPPFDYREPGPVWERGGRGRGMRGSPGWGRGGPPDRGGRYEDRSRRGDWESQRRQDEFYVPERREWQDRRDERRDTKDESRDKRDDKQGSDKDSSKEERRPARSDDKKDDRRDDRDKKDDRSEKDETKRRDTDITADADKKEKDIKRDDSADDRQKDRKDEEKDRKDRKDEEKDKDRKERKDEDKDRKERNIEDKDKRERRDEERDRKDRDRKDDDRRERMKEKDKSETRSRDDETEKKKEEESLSRNRERSRKRRASNDGSRSPSVKKARDDSPALSTHSRKSGRSAKEVPVGEKEADKEKEIPKEKEAEKDADAKSEKGSVAGSEKSKKADSDRSRHTNKSRGREEEKGSRKGSEEEEKKEEKKRSRSRSKDGSDSGDSKRRKVETYPEGEGQLAGYVIKDTVGSDKEDGGNFDSIEQNFSDWSDNDSDDDILNQPGEPSPVRENIEDASKDRDKRSPSPHGSVASKHSQKAKDEGTEEQKESTKPGEEEEIDEFESISSDEGSLLGPVKTAAVDALEIDWASMLKDDRPKPSTGSALQRFKPGNIFAQMGISRQYAGESLYNEVLQVCQRHHEETAEAEEVDPETPVELKADSDNAAKDESSEIDTNKEVKKPKTKFEFHHDVALFHSAAVQKLRERRNLLSNIGPFRRALSARRDLEIRRQLCKVDKVLDQSHVYPSQDLDSELYRLSVQMLKQAKDPSIKLQVAQSSVDNRDTVCSPVPDNQTVVKIELTCS